MKRALSLVEMMASGAKDATTVAAKSTNVLVY